MQNYAFESDPFFNISEILKHFKNVSKCYKNGMLFTLFETRFNAFQKRFIHDSAGPDIGRSGGAQPACAPKGPDSFVFTYKFYEM